MEEEIYLVNSSDEDELQEEELERHEVEDTSYEPDYGLHETSVDNIGELKFSQLASTYIWRSKDSVLRELKATKAECRSKGRTGFLGLIKP